MGEGRISGRQFGVLTFVLMLAPLIHGIPARAAERGKVRLVSIRREDFDHGGTRDLALRSCSAPFIVMMTQDAMPVNDRCMESLLSPFADSSVAAVCGRQIAFPEAKPAEKAVRDFRYPAESDIWEKKDIPRKGIIPQPCSAVKKNL